MSAALLACCCADPCAGTDTTVSASAEDTASPPLDWGFTVVGKLRFLCGPAIGTAVGPRSFYLTAMTTGALTVTVTNANPGAACRSEIRVKVNGSYVNWIGTGTASLSFDTSDTFPMVDTFNVTAGDIVEVQFWGCQDITSGFVSASGDNDDCAGTDHREVYVVSPAQPDPATTGGCAYFTDATKPLGDGTLRWSDHETWATGDVATFNILVRDSLDRVYLDELSFDCATLSYILRREMNTTTWVGSRSLLAGIRGVYNRTSGCDTTATMTIT